MTEHENIETNAGGGGGFEPKMQYAYDPRSYIFIIDNFLETGCLLPGMDPESESLNIDVSDPMILYIFNLLTDDNLRARILASKVMGMVFRDMMVQFIISVCDRVKYQYNRSSGELKQADQARAWSLMKRQKGTEALLQQIDEQHNEDGFDKEFYEQLFSKNGYDDQQSWEKMCSDWKQSIRNKLDKTSDEEIKTRGSYMEKALGTKMNSVKQQLDELGVSDFDALQAWQMMDGQWTETEFEKKINIVQIRNKYPEIAEVCRRMGRVVNESDRDVMQVSAGNRFKIEHASGSDIEGITVGNEFTALLPYEVAQFADASLQNLFLQRFVTKKLQMFRYKSEMTKPSRKLNWKHASRRGPMIACVDSSASMQGVPRKIAVSLLGRLETTAEMLKRDCFLIDFSVDIRPIDLKQRIHEYRLNTLGLRSTEQDFSKGLFPFISGGTDATKMMELTFDLLENSESFQNADVLWITDFLIPFPEKSLLKKMQEYRKSGTKFYGFQIGMEPNKWESYFDKTYKITYRIPRRF